MKSIAVLGIVLYLVLCTSAAAQDTTGSERSLTFLGSYGGRQFFQAEDSTASFEESETRCLSQGMALAKVHSAEELKYLGTVVLYPSWVAGKSTNSFEWLDGSTVTVAIVANAPVCLYLYPGRAYLDDAVCTTDFYTLCHSL